MPEGVIVTRTVRAKITNHSPVHDDLDRHGRAASRLWNAGLRTIHRVWEETGDRILDDGELGAYLKMHERYEDLPAQSSQRVLQELAEAFYSWYAQDSSAHNPPGYRKHGDRHPRSTVTWKSDGNSASRPG